MWNSESWVIINNFLRQTNHLFSSIFPEAITRRFHLLVILDKISFLFLHILQNISLHIDQQRHNIHFDKTSQYTYQKMSEYFNC